MEGKATDENSVQSVQVEKCCGNVKVLTLQTIGPVFLLFVFNL